MTQYDQYSEALAIAERMEACGLRRHAVDIRNSIDDGVSGTEIFMKLRFYLVSIATAKELDVETRARIRVLIEHLNAALE
ncbi:hypothetical protein [Mesorhizobium sp. NPDC059025]|uniref:hypothetical protein n=1 Tax=unclassified Mesorhizobium TaxID=325217 RepID=UPI0036CDD66D